MAVSEQNAALTARVEELKARLDMQRQLLKPDSAVLPAEAEAMRRDNIAELVPRPDLDATEALAPRN